MYTCKYIYSSHTKKNYTRRYCSYLKIDTWIKFFRGASCRNLGCFSTIAISSAILCIHKQFIIRPISVHQCLICEYYKYNLLDTEASANIIWFGNRMPSNSFLWFVADYYFHAPGTQYTVQADLQFRVLRLLGIHILQHDLNWTQFLSTKNTLSLVGSQLSTFHPHVTAPWLSLSYPSPFKLYTVCSVNLTPPSPTCGMRTKSISRQVCASAAWNASPP
jgi:hypothetical protein